MVSLGRNIKTLLPLRLIWFFARNQSNPHERRAMLIKTLLNRLEHCKSFVFGSSTYSGCKWLLRFGGCEVGWRQWTPKPDKFIGWRCQNEKSTERTLHNRVSWGSRQAGHRGRVLSEVGKSHRPLTDVEQELAQLKRELAQVKMERDILKKAAYFAKESLPGTR